MSDNWATPAWIRALLPPGYWDPCPSGGQNGLTDGGTAQAANFPSVIWVKP